MTNDTTRLLTADELESVVGGDIGSTQRCGTDEMKIAGVTVLKVPVYSWDYWW